MEDLGEAMHILGMEIGRDKKKVGVPLGAHLNLLADLSPKIVEDQELMSKTPYMSAVGSLMHAMVFYARTKHIDVGYHFVRDVLEDDDVEIVKIHTKDNPTDMLTNVVSSNKALLVQQGLFKVLSKKDKLSESIPDDEKEELKMKAHSVIQLYLADQVLREVANEDTTTGLWLKLESLYMIRSLTNKLYLKQCIFILYMKEDIWDPSQVPSKGGARFVLTLIDDYSRKVGCILESESHEIDLFCFTAVILSLSHLFLGVGSDESTARTEFNVLDFGAIGDGTTDDTEALKFFACNNLQVSNLTSVDSAQTHLVFLGCQWVGANNLTIMAPGDSPNTDGIHIHASQHVKVQNSNIGTGDDCISVGDHVYDIGIENINCGPGHGISVGSLGRGGTEASVEEVHVRYVYFQNTTNGARIKTWQGAKGYAKGIKFEYCIFNNVQNPIVIDQYYCDVRGKCKDEPAAVQVSNVSYANFQGTSQTPFAVSMNCSQAIPCTSIQFDTVNLTMATKEADTKAYCINAYGNTMGFIHPTLDCLRR
ncbi:uncharacterized protein A4U43_C01F24620 [Asparagus officinalis]|uniref:Polygalacturonase n=1 Tax=Asparagus officinalis TaxID=4686 RepID=A0A5P1FTN7_ASPOF|nr:uncharacterized protein A4U43_C01F24620 [Asparagus officinalis]